jgi:hypothetical protein
MNRRAFLQTVGGVAVAGTVRIPGLSAHELPWEAQPAARPRVAVLWEQGFPTLDASVVSEAILTDALAECDVTWIGVEAFAGRPGSEAFDLLLTPYGSAFPRLAYAALVDHLARGRHWINLGGAPCAVPVVRRGEEWKQELRQVSLHRRLGITQAFPVAATQVKTWQASDECEWARALVEHFAASTVHELYVRFTAEKDFPDEDGSAGPRDAVMRALAYGVDAEGIRRAAPFVAIDRLLGEFAGGRWVFATSDAPIDAPSLRRLMRFALGGGARLTARPSYACYQSGETPAVTVGYVRPGAGTSDPATVECLFRVINERGERLFETDLKLADIGPIIESSVSLPELGRPGLPPGLYHVEVETTSVGSAEESLRSATGFWVHDATLLGAGRPLGVDATGLTRDGKPFPVTGTTYMASDAQRKFLLEPNPHVWNRDFALMKRAGVNLVRTGLWTGWTLHMPDVGTVDEGVLRAIDAFMLTARRHDMPVIFTFFAFLPETWGGSNPYLDPRAIEAQKAFIKAIVRRCRGMRDVVWDLINEPSFSSNTLLWFTRPNGDEHEARAWRQWLTARYPAPTSVLHDMRVQELWRLAPGEPLGLPSPEDFEDAGVFDKRRPLKAADYRLFAQEAFSLWAGDMAATVRSAGGGGELVMVGQDEGGAYERPSNQFFGRNVSLTSVHTWWLNDDLLWDSVVTRTPGVPNLVQETGVMFNERIDGRPWRTEEEVRDLLERKLALAVGAGAAGYVQWLWHSNCFMPSDNEAAIGMWRADGTAKPEFDAWRRMTAFIASIASSLIGREREQVLLVVPQSHLFSVRNAATDATRRAVRAMHYHCRVTMGAVGEHNLESVATPPPLVVLPCPRVLREAAWTTLRGWVEQGTTLAVSGPFDEDEHWLPTGRMDRVGIDVAVRPVAQEEVATIEGADWRLTYRGEKMQRVEKAVIRGAQSTDIRRIASGKGQILWSPLPIELAQEEAPTSAFYRYCLKLARIQPLFKAADLPSVLIYPAVYRDVVLFTIVSESASDTFLRFAPTPTAAPIQVTIGGGRAAMLLVDRTRGTVMKRYP